LNGPAIPRRTFFVNIVLGVTGVLGLGAFGARCLSFLTPPAPPERSVEFSAGRLEAIPDGGGTIVHLPAGHVAVEREGDQVRAFSAVCTHLGCLIQWQPAADHAWYCPCHHGRYDRSGRVVSGPPPRPLDPIAAVVRGGEIFVTLKLRAPQDVA
jgi:cytochrome b6-f complex iron-sulfur subunit